MKKVLITGGEGYFAGRFIQVFKDVYDIVAPSKLEMDIRNRADIEAFIKKEKPHFIVHAAAVSDGLACERDPQKSYDINVTGSINIVEVCKEYGIKMIFLSSDQVYNGNEGEGPYGEEVLVTPKTVYGKQKLEAEGRIARILDDTVILRITLLFDLPKDDMLNKPSILNKVFEIINTGERISLRANEYRGMTYIYDLVDKFPKIMDLSGGIYNAGSSNNLSTYDIGEYIFNLLGEEDKLEELVQKDTETYKEKKRDIRIDNSKITNEGIDFRCMKDVLEKICDGGK